MLVIQFRILLEPRKDSTMSLLVVSVATKPVMSEMIEFSNSVSVVVFAASTLAQLPCGQVILVLGLLLLPRQYEAAEYWLKNESWSSMEAETAGFCVSWCSECKLGKISYLSFRSRRALQ
jgi:hypothetical protein